MLKKIGLSVLLSVSLFGGTFDDFNTEISKMNNVAESKLTIQDNLVSMVDFELMGKLTVGKKVWLDMNKTQQKEYIELYEEKIKNSYLKYLLEIKQINIKEVKRKKTKYEIEIMADTHKLKVYAYDKNKDFKIYNINVDGINLIKILGQDFRYVYEEKGYKGLIEKLKIVEEVKKQG